MCVCIPYDACKCIALRCIHAPFNIFYIFIWCVYQNQRQSHLMEYWILSKVQFVHLCACKRNYFDESFRVSHERTRERWNGTADNIWSNAYVERYILHIAHCSLHHDTQIQTCIYSFRKYARDKWCSFIQMLARSIQYSCMPNALTLRSKLLVGIYFDVRRRALPKSYWLEYFTGNFSSMKRGVSQIDVLIVSLCTLPTPHPKCATHLFNIDTQTCMRV